jgi:hypothetical protein
MGRPLSKKYFGNTGVGGLGGESVGSVTLGGTNNSSGYGAGSVTFAAPSTVGGITATGTLSVYATGAIVATTTFAPVGTAVAGTAQYPGIVATGSVAGVGAVFTISHSATVYAVQAVTSVGSGYIPTETITILGTALGGTSPANNLVITLGGTTAPAGRISAVNVVLAGSGYTSVPAVTLVGGTQGTLTATAVLTTTNPNAIVVQGITAGATNRTSGNDVVKQVSGSRYKITTQDGTAICKLKASVPTVAGEMAIVATDSAGGTYYVTKLTARKATLTQGTGVQFATGASVPWVLEPTAATINATVRIPSA